MLPGLLGKCNKGTVGGSAPALGSSVGQRSMISAGPQAPGNVIILKKQKQKQKTSKKIPSAGKDVEKLESSHMASANAEWGGFYGDNRVVPQKSKMRLPYHRALPLLGV